MGGTDYVGNLGHIWGGWKDCPPTPDFPGPPEFPNMFRRGASPGTPWINGEAHLPWADMERMNGCFQYFGSSRLADITDGTANTILVFEDMHWNGRTHNDQPLDRRSQRDAAWASPLGSTNAIRAPMNMTNGDWITWAGDLRCHGWSSNHPGTAGAAHADGSVNFYADTINHTTRYKLGVRNDGFSIDNRPQ